MVAEIKQQIENLLYPELRAYGRADRDRLLKNASDTPLDLIEWVGILAALAFVVVLTRYSVAGFGLADRIAVWTDELCRRDSASWYHGGAIPRATKKEGFAFTVALKAMAWSDLIWISARAAACPTSPQMLGEKTGKTDDERQAQQKRKGRIQRGQPHDELFGPVSDHVILSLSAALPGGRYLR